MMKSGGKRPAATTDDVWTWPESFKAFIKSVEIT
jgi:hypothetical protein